LPGSWIGIIFKIDEAGVTQMTTQEKWDKFRRIISGWDKRFADSPDELPMFGHKQLEKEVGFVNHMGMMFSFLSSAQNPGSYVAPQKCSQWQENCKECAKTRTWTKGIFCVNFAYWRGDFEPCQRMWCGPCYSSDNELNFHVASLEAQCPDEDDQDRISSGWRKRKDEAKRFLFGTAGDDLMVSFECDFCVFTKLHNRLPSKELEQDKLAMACIRRIDLDAFWSRAKRTVASNAGKVREGLKLLRRVGSDGPYLPPGPLPTTDHCGYKVAIQMVLSSLDAGNYSDSHKQWDTIRTLRTAYSNQVRAAAGANQSTYTLADDEGKSYKRLCADPCGSLWFSRFMDGCRKRMGQDWRPDWALSPKLVGALLTTCRRWARDAATDEERDKWIMAGAYFCFSYVLSLRGTEGLMVDLGEMIKLFDEARAHDVIPLLGRTKGENHVRHHRLACVPKTKTGIEVRRWMKRLMGMHSLRGRSSGPAFVNAKGRQATSAEMNDLFHLALVDVFKDHKAWTPDGIDSEEDILEKYKFFRTLVRRSSESQAVAQGVSEPPDRYCVNRWKKKEKAGTTKPSLAIDQQYVDMALVTAVFLRYTKEM
jgi:hypothetical protein